MITDEQLAEWESLAGAATAGPWTYEDGNVFCGPIADARHEALMAKVKAWKPGAKAGPPTPVDPRELVAQIPQENPDVSANEVFIAASREAVPALVAALREARALLRDVDVWQRDVQELMPDGMRARIDAVLGSRE